MRNPMSHNILEISPPPAEPAKVEVKEIEIEQIKVTNRINERR